jgi:ferric-dicitrate binding protein FerR (iron transport regulator)
MDKEDKHITTDDSSNRALDGIQRVDAMPEEEWKAFLSDGEAMSDCGLLYGYKEAKLRKTAPLPNADKAWQNFRSSYIAPTVERRRRHLGAWIYASSAVAAVLAVVLILRFTQTNPVNLGISKPLMAFVADKAPQFITMSESGGQPAVVSGQSKEDGIVINAQVADFSHANIGLSQVRSIATPRGKSYKVILRDGTTVLMNADSKLTFPTTFAGKQRVVKLVGEAYFKVSKDAKHPFIVQTEKVMTRVLGTEFNLRAYPAADTHVTLITGSVIVNNRSNNRQVKLVPGQDATLRNGQDFDVTVVDTDYYIQWKDGYFYFDNLPLVEVMKELGRWYNVDVEIRDNSLMSYRLHFIAERQASIDKVVENLNEFGYLSVMRKGQKIIISKKSLPNE